MSVPSRRETVLWLMRGALRELADARPGRQLGERVEQRERAVDGRERPAFLSHRTRHVATTTRL